MATIPIKTYDDKGNIVATSSYDTTPEQDNAAAIADQLDQAIAYFSGNYRGWATMSAAQKDTAAKNAQRAVANLCRIVRNRFDTAD